MLAWLKRFLQGFNFASGAVVGKWIFYLCVFAVFMFGWSVMTGKKTTSNQKADEIVNYSYAPQQTFGCMRLDARGQNGRKNP